jgi:hypothetical protein
MNQLLQQNGPEHKPGTETRTFKIADNHFCLLFIQIKLFNRFPNQINRTAVISIEDRDAPD